VGTFVPIPTVEGEKEYFQTMLPTNPWYVGTRKPAFDRLGPTRVDLDVEKKLFDPVSGALKRYTKKEWRQH
jgi:hypothetical protein